MVNALAAVLLSLVSAAFAHAAQIRLPLTGAAGELDGLEVIRWREGTSQRVAAEVHRDGDKLSLDVAASCEPGGAFVITTKDRIGVADCGESLQLALHPRAVLSGRFAAAPGVAGLPAHGIARTSCANIPFHFDSKKTAELSVPAGCGVVAVHVAKLAPVLVPPDVLSTAKWHPLGDVFLKHGASLLARVRSAGSGKPIVDLTALVLRRGDVEKPGVYDETALQPLGGGTTDRHGWVAFYGLAPNEVVLALRRPGQRFPHLTGRYVLDPAAGLVLDNLEVPTPATVAVRLDIPEGLAGELALTNVELLPRGDNRWPRAKPISVPALADGTPATIDVPPGAWTIAAVVRLKDGFLNRSGSRQLMLAPGAYEDVTLAVRGGVYRGRVVRGGAGLRGVLNLSLGDGTAGGKATARTNDDGRFAILLEGPGRYTVDFQESGKGLVHFERYAEFTEPAKEVEIRLPAGQIRGRVTFENGVPVGKAGVSATAGEMSVTTVTGEDGTFTVDSVKEGTWLVRAASESTSGDPVEVPLLKDAVADGVQLIVRQTAEVGIHVTDGAGRAVADAFVTVELPLRTAGPMVRTNADGVARIRVPTSLQGSSANAVVSTLDARLASAIVRLDPERIATVRLPVQAGELRLKREKGAWADVSMARLVAGDGSSIPIPTRRGGAAYLSDTLIRLRAVPVGRWRYIDARAPFDELAIRALNFGAVRPVAEFIVRPGVVTEVEIPD